VFFTRHVGVTHQPVHAIEALALAFAGCFHARHFDMVASLSLCDPSIRSSGGLEMRFWYCEAI
jgi:hypothetical protein